MHVNPLRARAAPERRACGAEHELSASRARADARADARTERAALAEAPVGCASADSIWRVERSLYFVVITTEPRLYQKEGGVKPPRSDLLSKKRVPSPWAWPPWPPIEKKENVHNSLVNSHNSSDFTVHYSTIVFTASICRFASVVHRTSRVQKARGWEAWRSPSSILSLTKKNRAFKPGAKPHGHNITHPQK